MTTLELVLLLVYTAIVAIDAYGPQLQFFSSKVVIGFVLGIIFGDVKTGLVIGGTLQLMSMGVVGLAGASVPNYNVAALVAAPIAIKGGSIEAGLAIGIPTAMISVQLDIIHKIANGFVARWSQSYANQKQFKKMNQVLWLSTLFQVLKYVLPVAIVSIVGVGTIDSLLAIIPDWLMGGLTVAGKILPAVGLTMLLIYMPTMNHFNYLIIGFVLFAYLKLPILAVALIGLALAFKFYKDEIYKKKTVTTAVGGLEDE